jgi:Lrp/AsnC family leucine-responsive transcriptional regulator
MPSIQNIILFLLFFQNLILFCTIFAVNDTQMNIILDDIDLQILKFMQSNARISNADLAREVNMAPSAVLERVKKLEQKKVIKQYNTAIDPVAVQQKLLAFIFIKSKEGFTCSTDTAQRLAAIPEVQEVHHIAGEDCFLVKVRTADSAGLMQLMRNKLQKIPNILSTKTTIVLETVKEQQQLIIPVKEKETAS